MSLADLFWTGIEIVFIASIVALAAVGNRRGLEARAAALQRRDPGTASALRQAQAVSDLAHGLGGWLPEAIIVCTPSRRATLAPDEADFLPTPAPAPVLMAARHAVSPRRVYVIASRINRTGPATTPRPAGSRRRRPRRVSRAR